MKPHVAEAVARRDKGCIAPLIDRQAGPCYDQWGVPMARTEMDKCERDHADWRGRGKNRKDATAEQVVMLCPGHHRGTGPQAGRVWAASHRPELIAWAQAG